MRIMGIKILSGGIIKGSGGCGIRTSMTTIPLIYIHMLYIFCDGNYKSFSVVDGEGDKDLSM